jgi:hypothetical protein
VIRDLANPEMAIRGVGQAGFITLDTNRISGVVRESSLRSLSGLQLQLRYGYPAYSYSYGYPTYYATHPITATRHATNGRTRKDAPRGECSALWPTS